MRPTAHVGSIPATTICIISIHSREKMKSNIQILVETMIVYLFTFVVTTLSILVWVKYVYYIFTVSIQTCK